jgi:hypothetical protein
MLLRSSFQVKPGLIQLCVAITGILLLAIIVGTPPSQEWDDLGLYNPIHVWLTTGHWAYPIYGQFDGMSVHPPFRYMEIAFLMKTGIPLYVALAIMPAIFTAISVSLLYASDWEPEIKVAACLAMISLWLVMFYSISIRPDAELTISWIAGLLALEYARQVKWHLYATMAAGALMTYASVMHYFGTLGLLGAAFYLIPIWRSDGFRAMLPIARKIIAGGACVLVPYLTLYIIPNWRYYEHVFDEGYPSLTAGSPWKNHFDLYSQLASRLSASDQFSPSIISLPVMAGIPPLVISALGFAMWPQIRLFGLAGLPMVLFVLIQSRKWVTYLYPEYFATILGFLLLVFTAMWLVAAVLQRIVGRDALRVQLICAFFVFCIFYLFHPNKILNAAMAEIKAPKILEQDIARAAAKLAVGDGTLVGGRLSLWYVSGATRWYDIRRDTLWQNNSYLDLANYFKRFDYIVDDGFMSDASSNTPRAGISTWYGNDLLSLRGFYLGSNYDISYIRLTTTPGPIIGHIYSSGTLSEFREQVNGFATLVTAFCQARRPELESLALKYPMVRLLLPEGGEAKVDGVGPGQQELILAFSQSGNQILTEISVLAGCGVKQIIHGTVKKLDLATVLPLARYDQNVMDFEMMQTQLRAEIPPLGSLKALAQARFLSLETMTRASEAVLLQPSASGVAFRSLPQAWIYVGRMPLNAGCIDGGGWIAADIHVKQGKVGVGVLSRKGDDFVVIGSAAASDNVQTIFLRLDSFAAAGDLVLRNWDEKASSEGILEGVRIATEDEPTPAACDP